VHDAGKGRNGKETRFQFVCVRSCERRSVGCWSTRIVGQMNGGCASSTYTRWQQHVDPVAPRGTWSPRPTRGKTEYCRVRTKKEFIYSFNLTQHLYKRFAFDTCSPLMTTFLLSHIPIQTGLLRFKLTVAGQRCRHGEIRMHSAV
jgi:hypothetical protein